MQISILKSSISKLSCWINLKKSFLKKQNETCKFVTVTKKLILKFYSQMFF